MKFGPEHPDETYVPHAFEERIFDTGEVMANSYSFSSRNWTFSVSCWSAA